MRDSRGSERLLKKPIPALVLMSGGIDSTACAHFLRQQGSSVSGLFVDYGQAARVEEARSVALMSQYLNIPLQTVTVTVTSEMAFGVGEIRGRNAFLITTALTFTANKPTLIAIGIHSASPYYDCSAVFFSRISTLVAESSDGLISLSAPFLSWSKRAVVDYFVSKGLPPDLTYSCELGTQPPCGDCLSCKDRLAYLAR